MGAADVATTLAALLPSCFGPPSVATRTHHVTSAVLTQDVAAGSAVDDVASAAILAAPPLRSFGTPSTATFTHRFVSASALQSSRRVRLRACMRPQLWALLPWPPFDSAASEQLWGSVDRRVHASLHAASKQL